MKLDAEDIRDLAPVIREVVKAVLAEMPKREPSDTPIESPQLNKPLTWSTSDLAEALGFSVTKVRRMDLEGKIPRPFRLSDRPSCDARNAGSDKQSSDSRTLMWDPDEIRLWAKTKRQDGRLMNRDEWEAWKEHEEETRQVFAMPV